MAGEVANKVLFNGSTLVDLTSDTVVAAALLKGYTAHKADGTAIQGTLFSPYNDHYTFTDQLTDEDGVGVTDQNGNAVQGATVYKRL